MNDQECKEIFARLSEYLDGELPRGSCQELEEHIRNCPPCVDFMNSLRKSVKLCRDYAAPVAPPALSPEVKNSLRQAYQRAAKKRQA